MADYRERKVRPWAGGLAALAGLAVVAVVPRLVDPFARGLLPEFDAPARHVVVILALVFGGWAFWAIARWVWSIWSRQGLT